MIISVIMLAALDVLTKDNYDFVYVHLEGPDEMGHQGSIERKVQAIEWLDERIIKPIVDGLNAAGEDFRMLILPDHPTPIRIRTHSCDPVPYLLYDNRKKLGSQEDYSEVTAAASGHVWKDGYRLMDYLLED